MASALSSLVAFLQDKQFLSKNQLEEVTKAGQVREVAGFVRELVRRGWITPYQAGQIGAGNEKELVIGPYQLLEPIGEGGMGKVFKARHVRMDRIVALKIIPEECLANANALARFNREVRAVAQLSHPNIVTAYEVNQEGKTHYFTMEFMEGIDLAKLVRQSGPLPIPQACNYIRQAALGLQHAHEKGLVHRDIKPGNLIVGRSLAGGAPQVKILDFGLARFETHDEKTTRLTKIGHVLGTVDYLSPEQAGDARDVDIRSDIFSLGCSLYYLLTGKAPFTGADTVARMMARLLEDAPSVRTLRPEVPTALEKVVAKMLARDPGQRQRTPAEVAADLEAFARSVTTQPETISMMTVARPRKVDAAATMHQQGAAAPLLILEPAQSRGQRKKAKNRTPLWPWFGGGAAFLLVVGMIFYFSRDPGPPSNPLTNGQQFKPAGDFSFALLYNDAGKPYTYRTDIEGKSRVKLIKGGVNLACSPDGKRIAFLRGGVKGKSQIYLMDLDGGNEQQLTSDDGQETSFGPAFSPDGKRLIYHGSLDEPNKPKQSTIYVVDADGTKRRPLTPPNIYAAHAAWSPDGSQIVYIRGVGRFCQLYLMDSNGDNHRHLCDVRESHSYHAPSWSGDGNFIAYAEPSVKGLSLFVIRPDGLGKKQLTPGHSPAWSPDGKRIAFLHRGSPSGPDNLYVIDADGTNRKMLAEKVAAYRPAWLRLQVGGPGVEPPPKFTNSLGMEFAIIPKGKSWLGGGGGKPGDQEVEIAHDFYLGKYEVTQEEWQKVMGNNPSYFSRAGAGKDAVKDISDADLNRFPVETVSWHDTQEFIKRLNERVKESGWVYRLPTEAEWEYACRGGPLAKKSDSGFDFYFEKATDQFLPESANFSPAPGKGLNRTCKVGSYKPNALGLHDMHGNVWEWCDSGGALPGIHGGCWKHVSKACEAASRVLHEPSNTAHDIGIRLARVPVLQKTDPKTVVQYLSDMQEFDVKVAEGRFEKNGNLGYVAGGSGRIKVKGKWYPKGLSMCPASNTYAAAKYKLGRKGHKLFASVAVNDSAVPPPATPLTFLVLGDGEVLWKSKPVEKAGTVRDCEVDVSRVEILELRVDCPGSYVNAQAVWLEPRVYLKME